MTYSYRWQVLLGQTSNGPINISNESVFLGGSALLVLLTKEDLATREFIKGGDLILLFTMQGRICAGTSENKFNCCIKSKNGNY